MGGKVTTTKKEDPGNERYGVFPPKGEAVSLGQKRVKGGKDQGTV